MTDDANYSAPETKHTGIKILITILFLLFILLASALSYVFFILDKRVTLNNETTEGIVARINQEQSNQTLLNQRLDKLMQNIHQYNDDRIRSQLTFLVQMAQMQLLLYRDVKAANQFLQNAYQLASAQESSSYNKFKQQLKDHMDFLERMSLYKVSAINNQIDVLQKQINSLSTLKNVTSNAKEPENKNSGSNAGESKTPWYKDWRHFGDPLKKLVVVRTDNPAEQKLLSTENETHLKNLIQSNLMMAKWATVLQDNALYQSSINQSKTILTQAFSQSPLYNSLIAQLSALEKINLKPNLPDLFNTINLLNTQTVSNSPPQNNEKPIPESNRAPKQQPQPAEQPI